MKGSKKQTTWDISGITKQVEFNKLPCITQLVMAEARFKLKIVEL